MSVVKRTKEGIDILEHAMKGVRTSGNRGQIPSLYVDNGIVGMSSLSDVRALDDSPVEREVIVKMHHLPPRPRR